MTKQGWVALHRKIQNHWLWDEKPFSRGQAWVDLLLLANHSDNKFLLGNELCEVKAGSFITSELKLSERWGWSKTKVRTFLTLLQSDQMIVKKSDRKKTTVTIVNYRDYTFFETTEKLQKNRKKTTEKPQKNTNNNENKENNEKNEYILSLCDVPKLNDALVSFVEYRKQIKKPMSERAVKLLIGKLNSMTSSVDEQIEILNQSIVNGWQGIFPLSRKTATREEKKPDWMKNSSFTTSDVEKLADKSVDDDPELQAQVEELKNRLDRKYGKRKESEVEGE